MNDDERRPLQSLVGRLVLDERACRALRQCPCDEVMPVVLLAFDGHK
jgi:hypothetical protein